MNNDGFDSFSNNYSSYDVNNDDLSKVDSKLLKLKLMFNIINGLIIVAELLTIVLIIIFANRIPLPSFVFLVVTILLLVIKMIMYCYREKLIKKRNLVSYSKRYRGNKVLSRLSWTLSMIIFLISPIFGLVAMRFVEYYYEQFLAPNNILILTLYVSVVVLSSLAVMVIAGKRTRKIIIIVSLSLSLFIASIGWGAVGLRIMSDTHNDGTKCEKYRLEENRNAGTNTNTNNRMPLPDTPGYFNWYVLVCPVDIPIVITESVLSAAFLSCFIAGAIVATKEYNN